jgi:signal transduction histidine kinase
MSKIIVEEHHKGYIRVENSDKGARFTIELSRPD